MNKTEIFELMDRFEASRSIHSMKFECEEFSLELAKTPPAPERTAVAIPPVVAPAVSAAAPAAPAAAAPEQSAPAAAPAPAGEVITSPLAGTFYVASSPEAAPFAAPGQHVKAGQTLCLVEAMKTMNEITAPCDCLIVEILPEDATLVSYGESLIIYEKE